MKPEIKVSLVMSSFSRANLLRQGLRSIIQYKPDFPIEIVVVNDGLENDGTKEVCDTFNGALDIKYVFTGQRHTTELIKRCPSIPNNIAIKQATGDIVILTCPEIVHLNQCLLPMVLPLLENKKRMTVPKTMYFDNKGEWTALLSQRKIADFSILEKSEVHTQMPFFLGVWKEEIIKIGGYDEDFTGYASEDNDFVGRLIKNGLSYYPTTAKVVHLFHGEHCIGAPLPKNPAWVYNKNLWESRKEQIIRNVGRKWGELDEYDLSKKVEVTQYEKGNEFKKSKVESVVIENVFTDIYKNRKWNSKETPSGTGSELCATENIRKEIPKLFEKYKIKRVLDIGCGNVNWVRTLFPTFELYLGIDVVKDLIEQNKREFSHSNRIQFQHHIITDPSFDPCEELAPYKFDVVILNDVLVHLSYDNIGIIINKLRKSGVKYILTTHFPACQENIDINSGSWRVLNLTKEPFCFPEPITLIENNDEILKDTTGKLKRVGCADKCLGLWEVQDLPIINGIPKILHLYWDKGPMAWLQTQTVTTFHKQNPDWEIRVYLSTQSYTSSKNKYVPDYTGKDYFYILKGLPYVKLIEVDLSAYGIDPKLHGILQSDIFRYLMLYDIGGVWSDFDVIWAKPISAIYNFESKGLVPTSEMGAFVCRLEREEDIFYSIGVLMAKPKHPFYKVVIDRCFDILKNNEDRTKLLHQSFGTNLLNKMFPCLEDIIKDFPDVVQMPYKTFYPYSVFDMGALYKETKMGLLKEPDVLCVHWFNGHKLSKEYINNEEESLKRDCTMTQIITLIKKGKL
jgi:2-polyprenyl-3-methyl-5-hydroxy-6-metoxy-1,4-benzoquinol methylase